MEKSEVEEVEEAISILRAAVAETDDTTAAIDKWLEFYGYIMIVKVMNYTDYLHGCIKGMLGVRDEDTIK